MDTPATTAPTIHALRAAVAVVICLVVAEWFHLAHANLAVWTAYMVLAQYAFTAFQKGLERVIGRAVGILLGLAILSLFLGAPVLANVLKLIALLGLFYVHFSGRLAYTFLNAGLYLAAITDIGWNDYNGAVAQGKAMFLAVVVGVVVADLVVWLSGSEGTLRILPGGEPLTPVRADWLMHSLMLVVTVELTQAATHWLNLPVNSALVSVMMITIAPDMQSMLQKGEMRVLGAFLGTGWGLGTFLLLGLLPHFLLLAALLFAGIFLAAYVARAGGSYAYAGVQMGLVLPLVVVVPPHEFGTLAGPIQRMEGIATALATSFIVGAFWSAFSPHRDDAATPAQR